MFMYCKSYFVVRIFRQCTFRKIQPYRLFVSSFLVFKYHLNSNSNSSQQLPKIEEAEGSNFPSPFHSAKVKGSLLESPEEETKMIRTIFNENKNQNKMPMRNNMSR